MQMQEITLRLLFFFAATKELRASRMEYFLIDRTSRLKHAIHLDQWLWPKHSIAK
jgi:hypothetical protein